MTMKPIYELPPLERAIAIAVAAHGGQTDKLGHPYILHPLRVMMAIKVEHRYDLEEDAKIVAVLHDVLEDTEVTPEIIAEYDFKPRILKALDAMTHPSGEPYMDYIKRVAAYPLARLVKIADIKDNMDPTRMFYLAPETVERLSKKYSAALKFLLDWDDQISFYKKDI